MAGGASTQGRSKVSGGRGGRASRSRTGSGSRGSSSRSSGMRKYEKKRSAEDLLEGKKSGKASSPATKGKSAARGSAAQREGTCIKAFKRQFTCLAPEVTFELDQEASNACKLLGCKCLASLFRL